MQNDRFDAISIPKGLEQAVKKGIKEGLRRQEQQRRRKRKIRYGLAAAALVMICLGGLLVSDPSLAAKLPVIGRIFAMVQEKVSYKGDFDSKAEKPADIGEESKDPEGREQESNPYIQTSNGLTVTVSEVNCSSQALYLALSIENEEDFPADFIKTRNMEGYVSEYDLMHLESISYYNLPGMGKQERGPQNGCGAPYYIEGEFVDARTFVGIIRISLDEDLAGSGYILNASEAQNDGELIRVGQREALPEQFIYYLEISDIYGELMEYEPVSCIDGDGNAVTISEPVQKHYKGVWNFAIEVRMNNEGEQIVEVNETNAEGVGIASVRKTAFEISAQLLFPSDANVYDYVIVICDAQGKVLDYQGDNAEVFSLFGRDTDSVFVYVCDYSQYMDELKGNEKKIAEKALFMKKIEF